MSLIPKPLYTGGQLTTAAATLYTSPTNTRTIVGQATFTNVSATPQLLTVYIVRSGGTATDSNILVDAKPLAPSESYQCYELNGQMLNPGDFIQGKADANSVITCAGINGYQTGV